ncbi:hypothetical protein LOC54_01285 [Acetobacter sp. AN02]|uniref:hypothetical protein n=1 Tax=Acetobacter sp. AN02 TaxID=2894186 RepID=UPI0024344113|nr:hypothetical protein [Acetobacter sp. AN02]MDG6093756.1 hypothetical protein [Acetobacter sp. AN02]
MMKIFAIPPALFPVLTVSSVLAVPVLSAPVLAGSALAAPVPGSCAVIRHDETRSAGTVVQKNVTVSLPAGPSLKASSLKVTGAKDAQSASELADAASVLFLTAMSNHHVAACTDWLKAQGAATEAALEAGARPSFSWSALSVANGRLTIQAQSAAFSVSQADGGNAGAALSLNGLNIQGTTIPDLLPEQAQASFSMPVKELSSLMQAVGGRPSGEPVAHVNIDSFSASRGDVSLSGNGSALLTGSQDTAQASGHLEVAGLNTLISAAQSDSQTKLAAGMVVAKLVSHKSNGRNTWDASWKSGVLTVNGVPVPLR